MKNINTCRFFFLLIITLIGNSGFAQSADIIFTNGKVFTSDTTQLYVQAIAIKGNKILAIGTDKEIEEFSSGTTKKIDLKGKTVVPGFNDAHAHLGWLIPTSHSYIGEFSFEGLPKNELLDTLSGLVNRTSAGQWIQASIGMIALNDTSIRRELLDSIVPNNPLALITMWGHGMIVNSEVLKALHVSDTAANPLGGWYERRHGSKYITGALYEYAQFPVWEKVTISDTAALINFLRSHTQEGLALGITTVQNMSSTMQGNAARRFFKEADLPVRVRIIPMPGSTTRGRNLKEVDYKNNQLTPLTYITGMKYMIDGTSSGQMDLNFPKDTIEQILREALSSDQQLMLHITGDSATDMVLELMKQMASADQWKQKRVRIEHGVGVTSKASMNMVKELGIIIDHTPQYGKDSPLRTWINMGIPLSVGPDGLINPYVNMMIMTTQQSDATQNISREQAVIAYTRNNAYAEFAENEKGTLMPGMLADLAVLSQDIFTIPTQQLSSVKSVLTMIDGKIVYQQGE